CIQVIFLYPGSDKQPTLWSKDVLALALLAGWRLGYNLCACSDFSYATVVKPIFSALQESLAALKLKKSTTKQNDSKKTGFALVEFVPVLFNIPLIAEAIEMKEPDIIRSQKLDSGVRIQDKVDGEGPKAREGDLVEVNYVCRRSNGYFVHRIANRVCAFTKIRVQYRFQFANSCRCFDLFLLLLPRFDMLFLTSGITVSECNEKTNVLFVDTLKVKVLFSFKVGEKDSKSIKKKVTKPLK
ncbi:hypothetical protein Tco_1179553, partial [Tanacetum coccineum]